MFVRGGVINPGYGLYDAGDYGVFWSSVGDDRTYACDLAFAPDGVYPSGLHFRYSGQSVRCVALGD